LITERIHFSPSPCRVHCGILANKPPRNGIHEPSLKWIKAGIEFYQSKPFIGHVACEKWADWSLTQAGITPEGNVTIEVEKHPKDGTLWIYSIGEKGERYPIREVTWAFADENLKGKDGKEREIWVGVYACTPILEGRKGEEDALTVGFEGWELDVDA
jgi:regulation of enolase protein 1 (concanavalin A-like superfamily)